MRFIGIERDLDVFIESRGGSGSVTNGLRGKK
jgi:hypothetical protein